MKNSLPKKVNIFITIDQQSIGGYFSAHDPAPLYKRQLDHQFEQYILQCADTVMKYSVVFYKLKCSNSADRQYAEPLMYAIRRHFIMKKQKRLAAFQRLKRNNFCMLVIGVLLLIFCNGSLSSFLYGANNLQTIFFINLDIFSWVFFLRAINKLVFDWSAHLKDITLLNKLSSSEMMVVNANIGTTKSSNPVLFTISQTG
ncbi:MAG: hypothetical protein JST21_00260 [Bacteroidetes bacterium]|nr:hypothetical protein [Bacteroidota bacterium]